MYNKQSHWLLYLCCAYCRRFPSCDFEKSRFISEAKHSSHVIIRPNWNIYIFMFLNVEQISSLVWKGIGVSSLFSALWYIFDDKNNAL